MAANPSLILFCMVPALFTLGACNRRQPDARADRPRLTPSVSMRDVVFHSVSLERDISYRVVLPAILPKGRKLPVVYLLHGGAADFRDWSNDSDVARFAEKGLILVMPEGEYSYYTNSVDRPKDRFEDYIVKDLIDNVEQSFPADPSRRAIAGVSMGGFGAIRLALKYPGLDGFAGALSPAIDVPNRPFSLARIAQYRSFSAIFGPHGSQSRKDNDPFVIARRVNPAEATFLFIRCGEQEGLLGPNREFAAELAKRNFRFEYQAVPGSHSWDQWNRLLPEMFGSLSVHMHLDAENPGGAK